MSFAGDRIRSARERAGLTQDELAARCAVDRAVVAQWEAGTAAPDPQALAALAAALQADPGWFRGTVAATVASPGFEVPGFEAPGFEADARLRPAAETRPAGAPPVFPARPPVALPIPAPVASRELSEKKAKPVKTAADYRKRVAPMASQPAAEPVRAPSTEAAPTHPAVSAAQPAPSRAAAPPPDAVPVAQVVAKPETAQTPPADDRSVLISRPPRSSSRPAASPAPRSGPAATAPPKKPRPSIFRNPAVLFFGLIFGAVFAVFGTQAIVDNGFTLDALLQCLLGVILLCAILAVAAWADRPSASRDAVFFCVFLMFGGLDVAMAIQQIELDGWTLPTVLPALFGIALFGSGTVFFAWRLASRIGSALQDFFRRS